MIGWDEGTGTMNGVRRWKSLKDDASAAVAVEMRVAWVGAEGPFAWHCVENVETRSLAHQTIKGQRMKGNE